MCAKPDKLDNTVDGAKNQSNRSRAGNVTAGTRKSGRATVEQVEPLRSRSTKPAKQPQQHRIQYG